MLDQTTMNGRHDHEHQGSPAAGVGHNLAGLTHDLVTLGELQCQLVATDLREGLSKSVVPAVLIVGAVLLALGTMPVILLGVGWALVNMAGASQGGAFLIVSLCALVIAAGMGYGGFKMLTSSLSVLKRSQRELSENVRWIKQVLLQQNTRADIYRQRV